MSLATLSIDLEARLARLDAGMTQAARMAEKHAAAIQGAFSGVGRVLGGLGVLAAGAFSTAAVAAFVRNTVNGIDALGDFADAVGTSVENASALEDAAVRTGTSVDTATQAVVKLNQTLKDAKPDSAAAQALKAIGLSAEELRRQDPAEALLQVARALAGYADDGNKARLVMELFGKNARELAPFLKDLAEQQRLVATVTTEQQKEAERLNREWAAMQKNVVDLSRSLAGPMITALNGVFEAFRRGRESGKGFFAAAVDIEKQAAIVKANAGTYSNEGRNYPAPSVPDVSKLGGAPGKAREGAKPRRDDAFVGPPVPPALQAAFDAIRNADENKLARLRDELDQLLSIMQAGGAVPSSVLADLLEQIDRLDPHAQEAARAMRDLEEAMSAGKAVFEATRTPSERLQQQIEHLNKLLAQGAIDWDTYARAMFDAQDAFDQATKGAADQADKTADVARELGLTFSSAFEDAIVGGESLREVLRGLEQDILRIVTRKLVTEPLAEGITGLLKGGGGGIFEMIGKLFGGTYAEGGFLPPGRWGIAGERGPEPIFGGRTGLTVQPAGAGITVHNTFMLSGPADMRTQQQIAAATARGVERASRRNN